MTGACPTSASIASAIRMSAVRSRSTSAMVKGVCVAMDQSSLFVDVLRDSRVGTDWRLAETLAGQYAVTIMRQFERECPDTIRALGLVVP